MLVNTRREDGGEVILNKDFRDMNFKQILMCADKSFIINTALFVKKKIKNKNCPF